MNKIFIAFLLLLPFFSTAQPLGTWPVSYGDTPPTHTPSGSGTRIYLNISTNDLWNWNPAPVSAWVKYPKGFDQISGCAAPAYTPTARQSVFAVNSCTVLQNGRGPELYQYTGSAWVCLNCYAAYSAGTGISISGNTITNTSPDQVVSITGAGINVVTGTYPNFTITGTEVDGSVTNELQNISLSGQSLSISSGTGVTLPVVGVAAGIGINVSGSGGTFTVSNTGDLSNTNELNTSFSVSGGNLALTDAGGTINVAVSSIAPVQAVSAGTGISISGTTTRTITNTGDLSATNEIQTLSLSGSDLTLSDGGGTVTLPGGTSDALGTGFTGGGGNGTIPGSTNAEVTSLSFNRTDNDGITTQLEIGDFVDEFTSGTFSGFKRQDGNGRKIQMGVNNDGGDIGGIISAIDEANNFQQSVFGVNPSLFQFGHIDAAGQITSFLMGDDGPKITDGRTLKKGLIYAGDYSAGLKTNDRSLPDVGTVNLLKQTPVPYTNAAAPNNTIFYSTTLNKLAYKDPGGTVNALY